jgi:hypothetical protein
MLARLDKAAKREEGEADGVMGVGVGGPTGEGALVLLDGLGVSSKLAERVAPVQVGFREFGLCPRGVVAEICTRGEVLYVKRSGGGEEEALRQKRP